MKKILLALMACAWIFSLAHYSNVSMEEKVGPLDMSLSPNDEQITIEAGNIILYQGSNLIICYDINSWNFTRLGKNNGVTKEELLRSLEMETLR
ncbi:MAG: hypothetical protein HFE73_08280 [Firmicutes bacterium]|nr:hypothetical protein [Bacillota bacterium]